MRVVTDAGAVAALANSPELAAVLRRKAEAGAEGARRRARVRTGAMRVGIQVVPIPGGWRVISTADYSAYNEYGTSRMAAQPFMRPSMDDVRAAT